MQQSRESHKLVSCVHTKTVHWHGREMTAEQPFKGRRRRLAHAASYEELLCQEPDHVACFYS
jgi:hypothetical protein